MANLKYKNSLNEWKLINNVRGPEGPAGPKGDNAIIKLNGTETTNAIFYAPITSGTEGQTLKSHGGQVPPTWEDPSSSLTNIDNLTESTFSEEKVLSAHQGYVLNQNKVEKSTTVAGIDLQDNITISELFNALKSEIMLAAHPVGSLYFSEQATNPETLFGGTWTQITDTFIWAAGSKYAAGTSGGSASLQAHTHEVNITSGANNVGHTHSIPALTGTAKSSGAHTHNVKGGASTGGSTAGIESYASRYSTFRTISGAAYSAGAHTHDVETNASTTGGVSQNHTHTVSGNTGSTGDGDSGNMPPFQAYYCWRRTA